MIKELEWTGTRRSVQAAVAAARQRGQLIGEPRWLPAPPGRALARVVVNLPVPPPGPPPGMWWWQEAATVEATRPRTTVRRRRIRWTLRIAAAVALGVLTAAAAMWLTANIEAALGALAVALIIAALAGSAGGPGPHCPGPFHK